MRTVVLLTIALTLSIFAGVFAQDDYIQQIDGIVVTASRSPSAFNDLARSITIIGPSEIEEMPAGSIADLLSGVLSADVRNRGVHGVQADISLRGGTFEQVLILIDGIKVSDPQTGHHNLNLPITRSEIERIEILSGAASKLYGPNAMGGVINIITKKETSRKVHLEASGGEFGLSELAGRVTLPVGAFSTSRKKSNGYIENTEFDILTLSYANSILLGGAGINFSARYMDKEFGAYKFYSDFFPNEWEATEALFLTADANLKAARFSIIPRVSWRRHKDDFILDQRTSKLVSEPAHDRSIWV